MNSLSLRERILRQEFRGKLLWLLILTGLVAALIIILPRIATAAPAVDSKMLAIRFMFGTILMAATWNWRKLVARRWRFTDTVFAGLVTSFMASALFSGKFGYCLSEFWHLGAFYCLGWLIYRLKPATSECIGAAWVAGGLGFLAALYGFLTYIGFDILRELYPFSFEGGESGGRNFIHSFYGNPEYFGGVAAPTSILLLGLALAPRLSIIKRSLFLGSAGFIILVLLLSGSRGALLGFGVGAGLVFVGQVGLLPGKLRKIGWAGVAAGMLAVAVGLVIFSTPNPINRRDMRLAQRFTGVFETKSASTRERILFYTSTAMAIPQNPVFGFGPGTYRLEFFNNVKLLVDADPRAGTTVLLNDLDRRLAEHTHNDFLEFWFEQGTIGIGLLLLLISHAAVRFSHSRLAVWRRAEDLEVARLTAINVTFFAAAVTLMINAVTSFPLHMPARGTLAWVIIGVYFATDANLHETLLRLTGTTNRSQIDEKDET